MKKRIYSGKKYLSNISSSNKKEIWHYSFKYEGQKSFWGRTEESPEEYEIRLKVESVTIKFKSKDYNLKELILLKESLNRDYEFEFEKNEALSEDETTLKNEASRWKSSLRSKRRKGRLEQEKVDVLNQYGMVWNPKESDWEKKFVYFKKHGLDTEIEKWVSEQRILFEKGKMQKENFDRLKAINFPFKKTKNEIVKITNYTVYKLIEELNKKRSKIELTERKKYNLE